MKTNTAVLENIWKGHLQGQLETKQNTQNIAISSTGEDSGSPKCISRIAHLYICLIDQELYVHSSDRLPASRVNTFTLPTS